MGIYIGMKKIGEDENSVSYCFDMLVIDKKYYHHGKSFAYKVDSHIGYGYCSFNKKTKDFFIDYKKTDPYFLENKWVTDRVNIQLLRHLKENKFPEKTQYAS